jgi:pyruvate/2-oxoglutarate dehydrogenase complex dihydrolipoamide dehydrogenase (E3) component
MTEAIAIENVVLGGGEAGKYIAWTLAQDGRPVAVIERGLVGGSCPNIACLPSKNVIQSAKVADFVRRAASYGTRIDGATVDAQGVRQRKRDMVDGMIAIHQRKFAIPPLEFVLAQGTLIGPRTVEARLPDGGRRRFQADRLFLNLGTRASIPDVPGLADARPLTHVEALELDHRPSHLIVIGGGYVGAEFAQAFRRFGSQVTVLQRRTRLLGREDPDVSAAVLSMFEADGIDTVLEAETLSVEGRSGDAVRVHVRTPAGRRTVEGSDILVAAGRTPNTSGIGLEQAGIQLDARGFVTVNERLETTAPHVWALGDCAGSPQFTHVAFDDFRVVRDNLAGGCRTTRDRLIPYCIFIDPPLARVGLDESAARMQRIPVRVARLPMSSVLRARAIGETRGFMKMILAADGERILGFTMLGADAGEVLAVVQTAMLAGLPYSGLRDAILTHPTMAEGLNVLLAGVPPDESTRMAARALSRWEGEGGRVVDPGAARGQSIADHATTDCAVGFPADRPNAGHAV